MIEYFDVVDELDVPTGKKITKAEAHSSHIPHRCIAVFIFDQEGRLYIQHHKASGMFDHTVGGHVSAGEDYLIAAIREAEEEITLKNQKIEKVFLGLPSDEVFNPNKQVSRQFHMFGIFESRPDQHWKFVPNEEVEELSLMKLEDVAVDMQINPTNYTPGFINTMAKYLELRRPDIPFDIEACRKNWGEI